MRSKSILALMIAAAVLLIVAGVSADGLTPQQQLGKDLFFDTNLSLNNNQSCAACHTPEVGWTGPDETINLHGGVYKTLSDGYMP
jgi:cytochrome c peroxidase